MGTISNNSDREQMYLKRGEHLRTLDCRYRPNTTDIVIHSAESDYKFYTEKKNQIQKTMATSCMGAHAAFMSMMFLTTSFFFVEIIVGYATNSMALVADSFHMLSDIISLFVGFFAMRFSKKSDVREISSNTFGWVRAEVLGALVNAVFLVALCFSILVEALKRLVETEELNNPDLILIVGGTGLAVNLIGMFLFHGHAGHGHSHGGHGHSHGGGAKHSHSHGGGAKHSHGKEDENENQTQCYNNKEFDNDGKNDVIVDLKSDEPHVIAIDPPEQRVAKTEDKLEKEKTKTSGQMNMRGVYLHILGDALGSVIVIIAALIIKYCKGKWTLYVDPGLSIIMVMIILKTSIPLLIESSRILLQNVPTNIELTKLEEKLLGEFPQIKAVHEFHVWQLTSNQIVASLHVMCSSTDDYNITSSSIKQFFHHEGIHSTTVQPEFFSDDTISINECLLACVDESCAEKLCCKPSKTNTGKDSRQGSARSNHSNEQQQNNQFGVKVDSLSQVEPKLDEDNVNDASV